jgi:glycosyltransferase involved in cell wall biosynthesis
MGGGERVLLELAAMYPEAPVHTLLFDPLRFEGRLDPGRIRTSWLQRLPAGLRRRPRLLLPLIPSAVEAWDFAAYDVVISSSVAFVKNVLTPVSTVHITYCHAPMRFAWDYWPRYLEEMRPGPLKRIAVTAVVSRMRLWDLAGSKRVDAWIANSETTAERLRKYYRVEGMAVVHPPVDVAGLRSAPPVARGDDFVTLSTLTEYKRIDLAVRAFTASGRPLVVIGEGPDRGRLERLAGPSVRFVGHVSDAARARALKGARALLFPGEEDFGIAAVESLACGTPVIAYGRGGITEIVSDGRTGVLFADQTPEGLNAAVDRLLGLRLSEAAMVGAAQRFAAPRFRDAVARIVEEARPAQGRR